MSNKTLSHHNLKTTCLVKIFTHFRKMTSKQKATVLLGPLTQRVPRSRAHGRRVNLLIARLIDLSTKRGGIVPKIFKERELTDTDKIVVEGDWNEEMERFVATEFKDASVEHGDKRTEIYLRVKNEGIVTSSPWTDVIASLSVTILCSYLLYLFVYQ